MKVVKSILVLVGAALMLLAVSCASKAEAAPAAAKAEVAPVEAAAPTTGEIFAGDVKGFRSIAVVDNHVYGKNFQFCDKILDKDYKAQVGDIIKIHLEGTVDKGIIAGKDDEGDEMVVRFNIIDASPAANYWTPISDEFTILEPLEAGASFAYDMEFVIRKNATGKVSGGCANFMVASSNNQKEAINIKPTKFTYSITRN